MLRPVTLLFACSALLFALASDAAAQDDTPTRPSGTPSLVPPQGERVAYPIEIVADPDQFTWLSVGNYTCALPCRLSLWPGVYPAIASGKSSFAGHLEVPAAAMRFELNDDGHSARVAAAVLIPAGIVTAAGLWALAFTCESNDACAIANLVTWPVLGGAALFTGIGLLGWASTRRVELRPSRSLGYRSQAVAPRLTGLGGGPLRGGGASLGLTLEF